MKLLVSESEKERILGMHNKVRKMLFEAMATDVANWDDAETWVATQNGAELGEWPTSDPEYKYAKYKNYQGNQMEIQNNGKAQEINPSDWSQVRTGTWTWNGSKVIFSWMKPEVSGWEDAKQHFIDTDASDWNTGWTYDNQGIWNNYEWARVKLDYNPNVTLEIKSDGTFKMKRFDIDDTELVGKWSWDGSKIIFNNNAGMSKRASGYFTEDDGPATDTGLIDAVFNKNKIGNIGAKGPVVKHIQFYLTPSGSGNIGTGDGCGDDVEKCDGVYGSKTKELVKKYQEEELSVTPDGIWGKETTRKFTNAGSDKEDIVD